MNRAIVQGLRSTRLLAQQIVDQSNEGLGKEDRDDSSLQRLYEAACRGHTSRHKIPYRDLRDLTSSVAGAGGYTVATAVRDALNPLPPEAVTAQAGVLVEVLPIPAGPSIQPAWDTIPSFQWLPTEGSPLTNATPALRAVATALKLGGAYVKVSHQLDRQSNAVESLRSLLRRIAAIGVDQGFLNGAGVSGAPLGLLNTAGLTSQSGTSLAWSGICTMEEAVALKDAEDSRLVWVAHPTVRKLLRQRETITGGGRPVWEGNTVAGHRALVSTNMPSASLLVGDFSNSTVLLWGGIEVLVNPYSTTGFQQGTIELAVFVAMDVAVNFPAAFAKSTAIT